MFTVQQVLLIDHDMESNAKKEHKLSTAKFSPCIKVSVNSGIALLYLRQQNEVLKEKPRLIILNVNTPIMNGYEFLSELRNSQQICTKNLFIAVVKDKLSAQQIEKLRIMGVTNFIEEDFCVKKLSESIQKQSVKSFPKKESSVAKHPLGNISGLQVFAA